MAADSTGVTAEVDPPSGPVAAVGASTPRSAPAQPTGGAYVPPSMAGTRPTVSASTATTTNPAVMSAAPRAEVAPKPRKVRRGRRVKRVVRRIELWSVLKLALVFYACMYAVVLGALALLWGFAYSAGLVDNMESFANDVGFEHWQFYGEHMFRQAAAIGGILVVAATILTVLATALVNVISELTGGIRLVVIEEEVIWVTDKADALATKPAEARADAATAERGRGRRRRNAPAPS